MDVVDSDVLITPASVRDGLRTQLLPQAIQSYQTVQSTQDLVRQQAHAGAPEGLLVLAEQQLSGRGRLDRSWVAPAGSSLLTSLLLRPVWLAPAHAFALTMLAALSLAEAVAEVSGLDARLKWPNDLLLPTPDGWRKAAGILLELELRAGSLDWAIVGCGLNINWNPAVLPELAESATSVAAACGRELDRVAFLQAYLTRIDARYAELRHVGPQLLHTAWTARLHTLGHTVQVDLGDQVIIGLAESVDVDGALLLRDASGTLRRVLAGDVRLRHR